MTIYNPNDELDSIAEVASKLSVSSQNSSPGAGLGAAAAAAAVIGAGTLRPPPQNVQPGDTTLTIDFGEHAWSDSWRSLCLLVTVLHRLKHCTMHQPGTASVAEFQGVLQLLSLFGTFSCQ